MTTKFVSRAGEKLEHAITHFDIKVTGLVCADFGSSTGGFTDCLLKRGASLVYAVDTAYGELDWQLRNNPKVVVMERTNAMYVELPQKADIITIDTGWTKQLNILPSVKKNLKDSGLVITLLKPHYESPPDFLRQGKLMDEFFDKVMTTIRQDIKNCGFDIVDMTKSPILGSKARNKELLALLKKSPEAADISE